MFFPNLFECVGCEFYQNHKLRGTLVAQFVLGRAACAFFAKDRVCPLLAAAAFGIAGGDYYYYYHYYHDH